MLFLWRTASRVRPTGRMDIGSQGQWLFQFFGVINQTIRRAIVVVHHFVIGELWQDLLRDLFAVFHAPLVEAIDIPNNALHENFVLIQRNQFAQCVGRECVEHNGSRRAVAFKRFVRQQSF